MISTRFFRSVMALFAVFSVVLAGPLGVDAATSKVKIRYDLYNRNKKYGDEKIDIMNPTSRCNTAANQKVHDANLVQAKKDIALFNPDTDPRVEELASTYMDKLSLAWDAMEEPYCGFGAFGNSAAKKSYDKTVARARNEFLTDARKTQVALKK